MDIPTLYDKLREIAAALYETDDVEIDEINSPEDLSVAPGEGVWVRAWVWVHQDELRPHGLRIEDIPDGD